jgi:hypothetical protein
MLLLFSILSIITIGGESLSGRLKCLGFLVEGQWKMLVNFVVVIEITSVSGT